MRKWLFYRTLGMWHDLFTRSFSDHLKGAYWLLSPYCDEPEDAIRHIRQCQSCREALEGMVTGFSAILNKAREADKK